IDAYIAMKQYDEALADYKIVFELDSRATQGYVQRAWVYGQVKNYPAALADCDRAIALSGDTHVQAREIRASSHGALKKYDEALADDTGVLELDPRNEKAMLHRSWVNYNREDYAATIADCDRLLELTSGKTLQAYINRGDAYIQKHEPERAFASVRQ